MCIIFMNFCYQKDPFSSFSADPPDSHHLLLSLLFSELHHSGASYSNIFLVFTTPNELLYTNYAQQSSIFSPLPSHPLHHNDLRHPHD